MQKFLFLLMLTLMISSCNRKVDKSANNINDFVVSCVSQAKKNNSSVLKEMDIYTYCNCAADKALDEFTTSDLKKLSKLDENPDIQKRMEIIIEPCIQQLSIYKKSR